MSSKSSKTMVAAGAGAALVAAGAMGAAALAGATGAVEAGAQTADAAVEQAVEQGAGAVTQAVEQFGIQYVTLDKVEGVFSFTQTETASNGYLARHFREDSKYLCGAKGSNAEAEDLAEAEAAGEVATEDWVISVEGDVENGYSSSVSEIAESPAVQAILMGCSCMGNKAGGASTANALVNGISALIMVEMAEPDADANTVVFTSSDGYSVALPLSYLSKHYCPIVFDVNGSRIEDSMGGANQLWLGSTPASYFIRNIVSITVETRDEADVPASPTSEEARAEYGTYLPNVGILLGGEVA